MTKHPEEKSCMASLLAIVAASLIWVSMAAAQQYSPTDGFVLTDQSLPIKQVQFRTRPILMHLRTGYERVVAFPEPVSLSSAEPIPGCDIVIDRELVGFYPGLDFERRSIVFKGSHTGAAYELSTRASSLGLNVPIEIIW